MTLLHDLSQKWMDLVQQKNSLICAGLDPAVYEMGRGEKGLPVSLTNEELYDWSVNYIRAIAPHATALKYNLKYWGGDGHVEILKQLVDLAKSLDLLVIEDSKIADIGSTNDAAFYRTQQLGADTVTIVPYAGNMAGSITDATKRNLGVFTMCLMSNPEYANEKHSLTAINMIDFDKKDIQFIDEKAYVSRYIYLAQQSAKHGALGVVVGALGKHNHLEFWEVERLDDYLTEEQLILCPGTGAQGGSPISLLELFGDRVMVNLSRGLMFPEGGDSTPEQQAAVAQYRQEQVNEMR